MKKRLKLAELDNKNYIGKKTNQQTLTLITAAAAHGPLAIKPMVQMFEPASQLTSAPSAVNKLAYYELDKMRQTML